MTLAAAQMFLVAGLSFGVIGAVVAAALVRVYGARITRWEPCARHRLLLLLAATPLLTGAALLVATSLPAIVALASPRLDHCHSHDDGHAHLCFVHPPDAGVHPALLGILLLVGATGLLRCARGVLGLLRAQRLVGALARSGERWAEHDVILVESARALSLAAGLWRPRVMLSRGLLATLDATDLKVVLAHERAHVRRRDALVHMLARGLVVFHVPLVGRWLVQELEVAAEQCCDEEAARVVKDRLAVAATLLAVQRALEMEPPMLATSKAFGARALERRVHALLEEPPLARSMQHLVLPVVAASLLALGLSFELHHLTESLLALAAP